jgi:hypothetical protein
MASELVVQLVFIVQVGGVLVAFGLTRGVFSLTFHGFIKGGVVAS